eukprot:CAMPEP_0201476176 /NCGR_PEP_ID=MMETSP0151_2-20130828/1446_1 /ASSEMBLY_ACC=CAM_ASM_000257 /TAXON_ID=200890 /ORGANISM="Paramoeba atlantica, Strain 621/1 / CCAP 1560/9" /LENGTH=426 /DNA_ID=CAMNT_0047856469 /DNA_START=163 /DNA_END=1443 /DNA_ORIENTATION=-
MAASETTKFSFEPPQRLIEFQGGTVWEEFSPLAIKYNAINLGQGFPNFSGPQWVMDRAKEAIDEGQNQYSRPAGDISLVNAISELYSPHYNRKLDPMKEIVTTNGCSEGIFAAVMGLVDPGEEVVMLEPFFDIYNGAIAMAKAVPRYVPLRAPEGKTITHASEFKIEREELEAAMSDKTKLVLLNTPHNPTGKVFSKEELQMIADVVSKYPKAIVLADEVYEWLTFDGVEHVRFATLPNMWERTITACSAGKTFSVTGWKTGWVIGPSALISAVVLAHSYIPFCIATPFQHAIAVGLSEAKKRNYFEEFQQKYSKRRDRLVQGLREAGLNPIIPQGTFFVLADFSGIEVPDDIGGEVTVTGLCPDREDWNVCRYLVSEIGVAAIPPSAFYCPEHQKYVGPFIRFAFCKTDDEIEEACQRLKKLKKK